MPFLYEAIKLKINGRPRNPRTVKPFKKVETNKCF